MVLSIGIVFDGYRGDLSREEVIQHWECTVLGGRARASVKGPPCETWSAGRWLDLNSEDGGPPHRRMLEEDQIWRTKGLTRKQAIQVHVGNVRLRAALRLTLAQVEAR